MSSFKVFRVAKLTPMMAQYKQEKQKYPDCILMFRLGDFYEMFFEDALEAAKILQITLTSRNKGDGKAPMCGVPFHAVDGYLAKLTKAGKKVAICDQVTKPDGKGIVKREVVRVVTPGTTFDENILDNKANNYVSAVLENDGKFGFAYSDVTTGEFKVTELKNVKELEAEFMRINSSECICNEILIEKIRTIGDRKMAIFSFDYSKDADQQLREAFEIKSLKVFDLEQRPLATRVAGMLYDYLRETQKTDLKHIQKINFYTLAEFMPMNQALIRNLELFFNSSEGKKEGSLIAVLDQTVTSMGGRMLRNFLLHPLVNKEQIEKRLSIVESFFDDSTLLREIRENLSDIYDVERLISRLSLGSGNARDLKALQKSLEKIPALKELIKNQKNLEEINKTLEPQNNLVELIEKAIDEELPISVRDGGMIKKGFNKELDELRSISTEGKTFIQQLQQREAKRTGISSLKVKFNKVFGYYIEISKANLDSVPDDYIRKQTLVNAERFITPELKEYEDKVLNAEQRINELEYELFYEVRMEVVKSIAVLQKVAGALARLDVFSALAFLAVKNDYCKPQINEGNGFEIIKGRHPVIESLNFAGNFVPNDCVFDEKNRFLLITGPNMGGKSTFLRQVALISLMAQIGSFVPAQSAELSVVDRIFTRVGASDNLAKGESTFMVEMQEASYILNNATDKSLIILDEIGRGTSTYDGVSIAWAMSEFIHDQIKAKTLFATHYHELIELMDKLKNAKNLSVLVRENEREGVVFLYKVVDGGVDKSYGIEVAKLAGLPVDVVSRARGVLNELENRHIKKGKVHKDQIGMFEDEKRQHRELKQNLLVDELKSLDINKMTPLEAMQKLEEIRKKSS